MRRPLSAPALLMGGILALIMLSTSAATAYVPPEAVIAVDVDAPTRGADGVRVEFTATAAERTAMRYQLGFAPEGSCTFRQLEGEDLKRIVRRAGPAGVLRESDRSVIRGDGFAVLKDGPTAPWRGLVRCPGDAALASSAAAVTAPTRLGPVHEHPIEPGRAARLHALFPHLSDSSAPLGPGRFFVRVWEENAEASIIVATGHSYDASHPSLAEADPIHAASKTALAGVLVCGVPATSAGRERTWQSPLPWILFGLFSRLQRSKLLDQDVRRKVHDLVNAHPGIRFAELKRRTALGTGVLTHHLRVLEDHALIVTVRIGRQRQHYSILCQDRTKKVEGRRHEILALLASGVRTQTEIARRLGISQQAVSYHLRRLRRNNAAKPPRGAEQGEFQAS